MKGIGNLIVFFVKRFIVSFLGILFIFLAVYGAYFLLAGEF